MKTRKKLIVGITAPPSVDLISGQLKYFSDHGYDTYLLAPDDERVRAYCTKEGVPLLPIQIERNISPLKDFNTLFQLIFLFLREKPDVVNLGTPKISLLGMIAAYLTRVPLRIYTCRGFRFEHETGRLKALLIFFEKIISTSSHKIYCISKSVRDLGVGLNIFPIEKTYLIAKGSSNGVDLTLFNELSLKKEELLNLKSKYNLDNSIVVGFVGRLVDRKGLTEMYKAFSEVYSSNENIKLLVVGRPYFDQIKDKTIIDKLNTHPGIIMAGFQPLETIPYYLSLMDIFLLPAHWEGFGNVLIQAAAMGLPILATNVTGCKDAVNNGFNGVLVPLGNHESLVSNLKKLINDEDLRLKLGRNGVLWSKNFSPEIIWNGYLELFQSPKA